MQLSPVSLFCGSFFFEYLDSPQLQVFFFSFFFLRIVEGTLFSRLRKSRSSVEHEPLSKSELHYFFSHSFSLSSNERIYNNIKSKLQQSPPERFTKFLQTQIIRSYIGLVTMYEYRNEKIYNLIVIERLAHHVYSTIYITCLCSVHFFSSTIRVFQRKLSSAFHTRDFI